MASALRGDFAGIAERNAAFGDQLRAVRRIAAVVPVVSRASARQNIVALVGADLARIHSIEAAQTACTSGECEWR